MVGSRVEVRIGPVAHGGHCVARYDGRVIFVRHALPGELAVVRIGEVRRGSFCRGDAVQILEPAAGRVEAPCGWFTPGGCGGCDFQHAAPELQRELKAAVVREQLRRLAGIDRDVTVEALPGTGFAWRSRVRWALDERGRIGPRAVRSHRVEPVGPSAPCLIAAPGFSELAATLDPPPGVRGPAGPVAPGPAGKPGGPGKPAVAGPPDRRRGRPPRPVSRRPPPGRPVRSDLPEVVLTRSADGGTTSLWPGQTAPPVVERAAGRDFLVAADGFWQPHMAAAEVLAGAVSAAIATSVDDLAGATAWDLYGGVGLFAEVLCRAVGAGGSVVSVEANREAARLAAANLSVHPQAEARCGDVAQVIGELDGPVDVVVLDPPRTGAGPAVCAALAARAPGVIVYVACDPAALARDTAALLAAGYRLDTLRAFDCFPQTHHVECVARFVPASTPTAG